MVRLNGNARVMVLLAALLLGGCGGGSSGDAANDSGDNSKVTITAGSTSLTGTLAGSCILHGVCNTYFGSSYDSSSAVSMVSADCAKAGGTWSTDVCSTDEAIGHCLTDENGGDTHTSYLDMVIFSDYPFAGNASALCAANDPPGIWETFP